MKKLWQKDNQQLNTFIESFETGDDLSLDQELIPYDIQGSIAHAKMLYKIGILTQEELKKLEKGLKEIQSLYKNDKFQLKFGDEDMHTKIEIYLTEKYGEVGKKIHTGRSRNDQVLTAIRLYSKTELRKIENETLELIDTFKIFNKRHGSIPMPGYTHMQKAMPSSIAMWTESFIAALKDDTKMIRATYDLIDQSPLGSAAGYGVPLRLDKKYTAKLLNFKKVQENPIYCQMSRGKFEATILASFVQILLTINKFASDILLFTTQEFGFFESSDNITTGSSIMPQKKNLDLAELLRSKIHLILGNYTQIVSLSSNLISGYNRDLQDSKKPLIDSFKTTLNAIKAASVLINNLTPNKKKIKKALTFEVFATHKTLSLVAKGISFREAYQAIGKNLNQQNTEFNHKKGKNSHL